MVLWQKLFLFVVLALLAVFPAWLPRFWMCILGALAFWVGSVMTLDVLLPAGAEGPDFMAASLFMFPYYILFVLSCFSRIMYMLVKFLSGKRSKAAG